MTLPLASTPRHFGGVGRRPPRLRAWSPLRHATTADRPSGGCQRDCPSVAQDDGRRSERTTRLRERSCSESYQFLCRHPPGGAYVPRRPPVSQVWHLELPPADRRVRCQCRVDRNHTFRPGNDRAAETPWSIGPHPYFHRGLQWVGGFFHRVPLEWVTDAIRYLDEMVDAMSLTDTCAAERTRSRNS